jgi:hypothetical protein
VFGAATNVVTAQRAKSCPIKNRLAHWADDPIQRGIIPLGDAQGWENRSPFVAKCSSALEQNWKTIKGDFLGQRLFVLLKRYKIAILESTV